MWVHFITAKGHLPIEWVHVIIWEKEGKMNLIGIIVIVAIAAGLLIWKKCGGGCATKGKKEKK